MPELDPALVRQSQSFLADAYVADASGWGVIDGIRWDRFYAWLSQQGLVGTTIESGAGYSMDYLA